MLFCHLSPLLIFELSTTVAEVVSLDWIRELNLFALKPDLGILLDIRPEVSLRRVNRRRTLFENLDYLQEVRALYLQFVQQGELIRIDADRSKKEVLEEVFSLVQDLLTNR